MKRTIPTTANAFPSKWQRPLLNGLLLLGLCLRVATIFWGTPFVPYARSFHPDEAKAYQMTANFPEVYFTDERFLPYGTAFSYTLGMVLWPVKAVLVYALDHPDWNLIAAWMAARLAGVLLGTATIVLGYRLAVRLSDRATAMLAAAFIATSFYHTMNSAFGTLDVPMSFLLMANFLLCFRLIEQPSRLAACLFGVATAYLVGTKLTGVVFLAVPVLLAFYGRFPRQHVAAYLLTAGAVFIAFHPHLLLNTRAYFEVYRAQEADWNGRMMGSFVQSLGTWMQSTTKAMGIPMATLALAGAFMARMKAPKIYRVALLLVVVLSYALWSGYFPARFVILVIPILCIFAAGCCTTVMNSHIRPVKLVGAAMAVAGLTSSLYLCGSGIWIRWNDPRPAAARYLAETIPAGTTIGLSSISERYRWNRHPWRYPKIDFSKYREAPLWEYPEVVVTSEKDLESIAYALRSDALRPDLTWDPAKNKEWYMFSPPSPRLLAFYRRLLDPVSSPYRRIKSFSIPVNVPVEFAPTGIHIYRKVAD